MTPKSDQTASATQSNPVGTKDAPIDGKDGKPHTGPFVETEAERDRKKTKDSPDEEPAVMPSTGPAKEQTSVRQSNDGVMDDPNRVGPKDGTRGTEGGMSEKSKEEKTGEEKKPDPPKEAPPLPHSEQEMMKDPQGKDLEDGLEEEKQLLEVSPFNATLRIQLTWPGRNLPTFQINHMTFHNPRALLRPKMTPFSPELALQRTYQSHHLLRMKMVSFSHSILCSYLSP